MREIELRQDAIKTAVLSVDDVMKSALATLKANSEQGLNSMQEAFVSQMMAMQEMISKQTENLTTQMNRMPQVVHKLEELSNIPTKLDKLIEKIEKSNAGLAKQVGQSLRTLPVATVKNKSKNEDSETTGASMNFGVDKWLKWSILGALIVIALACIANLSVNLTTYNVNKGLIEQSVQSNLDSISSSVGGNEKIKTQGTATKDSRNTDTLGLKEKRSDNNKGSNQQKPKPVW